MLIVGSNWFDYGMKGLPFLLILTAVVRVIQDYSPLPRICLSLVFLFFLKTLILSTSCQQRLSLIASVIQEL